MRRRVLNLVTPTGDKAVAVLRQPQGFFGRAKGLLGETSLDESEGLLLPLCPAVHTCGMRIPVDVVFIRRGRVIRVVREMKPWRVATALADTAVELAAGTARRAGLVPGSMVRSVMAFRIASSPENALRRSSRPTPLFQDPPKEVLGMKKVSLVLVVALLLVTTATAHAESQTRVENLGSVRRVTVTTERIIPSEAYSNLASLGVSGAAGVGLTDSPAKADTTALTPVNTFFNESRLFLRGFADVWKATSGLADQSNLQSAQAKHDFWQGQGIYDKYTAREITFLNKVVFPAVGLARGLCLGGSVLSAAFGIAALGGFAFLPVLAISGIVVGGFTAYKWFQVQQQKADIAGKDTPNKFFKAELGVASAAAGTAAIGMYGQGYGSAAAGEAALAGGETAVEAVAGGVEAAGSIALPIASAVVGIYGSVVNSYGAVKLLNAWGIPEVSAEQTGGLTVPVGGSGQTVTDSQNYTVDYRITK
ncbi:MAG: DUF192 domain-containing protein [Bacillota bacterium]